MSTEFTIGKGRDIRKLFEFGGGVARDRVAHLGITAYVDPADSEVLSGLVTDDEDQADEAELVCCDVPEYAAGSRAIPERLPGDGLA